MFDAMSQMDPMMMEEMMGGDMGGPPIEPVMPHASMMPPPLTQNGGLQPRQEFVSPGGMDAGMGAPVSDLFSTLMGQAGAGMEGMGGMQPPPPSFITGAPPIQPQLPGASMPTALNPPVSDMMQDDELFNTMLQKQMPQPQMDPSQMGPQF